tara:strand:+ start:463 stop:1314 length:852 start_codon:yes stop_codon:yes gene_type:complete
MDIRCLDYQLSDVEAERFLKDGFLMIDNVLEEDHVGKLVDVADRLFKEERERLRIGPGDRINLLDFIGKDDSFLGLLDYYKTFPKVWGLLNWHIQLYHSHMTYTPVEPEGRSLENDGLGLGWHQDSDRINSDLATNPRPMISVKVAFFLTDTSMPGRGNFYVIPGSQYTNDFPGRHRNEVVEGAVPVLAPAGSAVIFDRRLWHSGSSNYWTQPRQVLFFGYSFRWLRPRDDMTVDHYLESCDPIRQQLLGVSRSGGHGYTSPTPEDVPLKDWLEEHAGLKGVD